MALGDPVFNLACRDAWIGWDVRQREERLSHVLDAYVLGAVPPYTYLLGGKLIGALVAAKEIRDTFRQRYGSGTGIISQKRKNPRLVLVTTTSALGRSSVYNRLHLPGCVRFERIGMTEGWGHFLVPGELFREARLFLKAEGDRYYDNYQYKQGPNWRLRALRQACRLLNIDDKALRHRVEREVYGVPLADNWRQILHGRQSRPRARSHTAAEIGEQAVARWVVPRAERCQDWRDCSRSDTWALLTKYLPP
jgi:hypothetical protein